MSPDTDCIILGAGVIGLAIARELARNGRDVLVVEQAEGIGTQTSSRNSEVIHAGIYYTPGSLKARSCVYGKQLLYDWCAAHGVPHRRIGKLIVAAHAGEEAALARIAEQAGRNGVHDLRHLDGAQARALEPELHCHSALFSPSTGIIDSHALMLTLQGDAENHGAQCVFHTRFEQGRRRDDGLFELDFRGTLDNDTIRLSARSVINATGLQAPDVARRIAGTAHEGIPAARYCKGHYFVLNARSPFQHLIYPLPNEAGLGVHLTLDMGGQTRFGPDTEWVQAIDYQTDAARAQGFYATIRQYWPALPDDALMPGYTGIRPKIVGPGEPAADFLILGPADHGAPGLVHLLGMESPGLTACLALAQHVHSLLQQ